MAPHAEDPRVKKACLKLLDRDPPDIGEWARVFDAHPTAMGVLNREGGLARLLARDPPPIDLVLWLLARGADPQAPLPHGMDAWVGGTWRSVRLSPLAAAVVNEASPADQQRAVDALANAGADVNALSPEGWSVLEQAPPEAWPRLLRLQPRTEIVARAVATFLKTPFAPDPQPVPRDHPGWTLMAALPDLDHAPQGHPLLILAATHRHPDVVRSILARCPAPQRALAEDLAVGGGALEPVIGGHVPIVFRTGWTAADCVDTYLHLLDGQPHAFRTCLHETAAALPTSRGPTPAVHRRPLPPDHHTSRIRAVLVRLSDASGGDPQAVHRAIDTLPVELGPWNFAANAMSRCRLELRKGRIGARSGINWLGRLIGGHADRALQQRQDASTTAAAHVQGDVRAVGTWLDPNDWPSETHDILKQDLLIGAWAEEVLALDRLATGSARVVVLSPKGVHHAADDVVTFLEEQAAELLSPS